MFTNNAYTRIWKKRVSPNLKTLYLHSLERQEDQKKTLDFRSTRLEYYSYTNMTSDSTLF